MGAEAALARALALPCWRGAVTAEPLGGGITNHNLLVRDGAGRFVVRIGGDIPVHGILRFNELACARAAHEADIAPEIVHTEPGALVMRYVEARTFAEADVRAPANLARVAALIRRCHAEVARRVRGPVLTFWVFQVNRSYGRQLVDDRHRLTGDLARLMAINADLESAIGPIDLVLGHNDLLPGNLLDDGRRLWLIDWEYAGFNTPLFDLANLASNNEFAAAEEVALLEAYFERPADATQLKRFHAMTCASLLREALWSLVSETHSALAVDYVAYTAKNLERFERAHAAYGGRFG
ncbi:MAG: phosphotransferase [Alphaproteobacteria bacterium]